MQQDLVIYQSPGKVLLVGGYAILNEQNHGLSLSVDKKIYSCIQQRTSNESLIIFRCQQFNEIWIYSLDENGITTKQSNQYLQAVVQVVYEDHYPKFENIETIVDIFIDPEFYSVDKKDFEFIGNLIDTPKTGLGSSSALIVCCLGALCGEVDVKLAIRANIIAQGKIGSGFDISTCITGSQIYKRPKYKLEKLSGELIPQKIQKVKLPDGIQLIIVDLRVGQNTIQSVKNFTKYLTENPQQNKRFLELSENSYILIRDCLTDLDYESLKKVNKSYRKLLKEFGTISGCDIEPDISTFIIDKMMELKEIVYGICPGAGGYDAMAFLVNKNNIDINFYQNYLEQNLKYNESLSNYRFQVKNLGIDYQGFSKLSEENQAHKLITQLLR